MIKKEDFLIVSLFALFLAGCTLLFTNYQQIQKNIYLSEEQKKLDELNGVEEEKNPPVILSGEDVNDILTSIEKEEYCILIRDNHCDEQEKYIKVFGYPLTDEKSLIYDVDGVAYLSLETYQSILHIDGLTNNLIIFDEIPKNRAKLDTSPFVSNSFKFERKIIKKDKNIVGYSFVLMK